MAPTAPRSFSRAGGSNGPKPAESRPSPYSPRRNWQNFRAREQNNRSNIPTGPRSNIPTGPRSSIPTGPRSSTPTGPRSNTPTGPRSNTPAGPRSNTPTGPKAWVNPPMQGQNQQHEFRYGMPTGPKANIPTGPKTWVNPSMQGQNQHQEFRPDMNSSPNPWVNGSTQQQNKHQETQSNVQPSSNPSVKPATSEQSQDDELLPKSKTWVKPGFPKRRIVRRRPNMHTATKSWKAPGILKSTPRHQLNDARRKIARNSPFFHADFDVEAHSQAWDAGRARRANATMAVNLKIVEEREKLRNLEYKVKTNGNKPTMGATSKYDVKENQGQETHQMAQLPGLPQIPQFAAPPPMRTAFDGREFGTNHSSVLSERTVFSPYYYKGKQDVAPWPSRSEMKYEGDDRISTDQLHARCLGLPRVPGNQTVNWQHRAAIPQHPFDSRYSVPNQDEVFHRSHYIPGLEFTDKEGEEAIGKDMMDAIDPKDQW